MATATKTKRRVFLIGRPRSGTASLHRALDIMGYNTVKGFDRKGKIDVEKIIDATKNGLSFTHSLDYDIEAIKRIEAAYPNAVFILSEREQDKWYASFIRQNTKESTDSDPRKEELSHKNKGAWVNKYFKEYNEKVLSHFKGREWKLFHLIYGVKNSNWQDLCAFLKELCLEEGFLMRIFLKFNLTYLWRFHQAYYFYQVGK